MSPTVFKSGAHTKPRGLSIKTNLPDDGPFKTKSTGLFPQLATAPPHKPDFEADEQPAPKKKVSEALRNDDWRRRPRGDSAADGMVTAPARKVQFTEKETKPQKMKLRVDTSLAQSQGGYRRYRNEKDTPIDPDFILSAPATRKEYRYANTEDESHEEYHDDDESSSLIQVPATISLGSRNVVRLDSMTPTTLAGFDKIRLFDFNKRSRDASSSADSGYASGNSAVSTVTLLDRLDEDDEHVEFPMAEIRAVKNGKRLRVKHWASIDEELAAKIQQLTLPRSAGLPTDMLRAQYQEAKQAVAQKGVLDDSAIQSMKVDGQKRSNSFGAGDKTDERSRFAALLAKLQFQKASSAHSIRVQAPKRSASASEAENEYLLAKFHKASAAHKLRVRDPSIIDCKASSLPDVPDNEREAVLKQDTNGPAKRRLSNDSAISGVSVSTPPKASVSGPRATTLNPKAIEFFCPSNQNQTAATIEVTKPSKFNRAPVQGLFDAPMPAVDAPAPPRAPFAQPGPSPTVSVEEYMALRARLEGMEAQLSQLTEAQLHTIEAQKHRLFQDLQMASRGMPPGFLPPGLIPPGQNNLPGMSGPGHAPNAANSFPFPFPPGFMPQGPRNHPMAPPPGFAGPASMNHPQAMAPSGMPNQSQVAPGHAPASQQANSRPLMPGPIPGMPPMGVKPVSKPKGPFRPGDPVQAKQQQEYEAYLEYRRANDIEYAKECKDRQARRAIRQRSGLTTESTGVQSRETSQAN